jgi:predicted NBD/HSP70 family sugar kinase
VAIDLRVERTVAASVSLGGDVLFRSERRHGSGARALSGTLRQTERLLAELVAAAPPHAKLVGVGVAVPGLVRHQDGVVRIAPNLGWVDVPLAAKLAESSGAHHVVVGNDADFGALAEYVRGAARGVPNVLYVSGEVGTGGGVILDGRQMTGAGGYGGEIGHMVVNPRGRPCHCGSRGCWETEVGEPAVIAAVGLDPDRDDIAAVVAAWNAGGREARTGLRRVARWLGLGLANLVNLFNPEIVVLGGMLSTIYPLVENEVHAAMQAALYAAREQVTIVPPALGRESALVGAAEAAFEALLDDPLGVLAAAGGR